MVDVTLFSALRTAIKCVSNLQKWGSRNKSCFHSICLRVLGKKRRVNFTKNWFMPYLLCISTSFWVLYALKSWSKHFFSCCSTFFVHFKAFSVISRLKSTKNVWKWTKKMWFCLLLKAGWHAKWIRGSTSCSSHIIFIMAPNIFLCSHKVIFTLEFVSMFFDNLCLVSIL